MVRLKTASFCTIELTISEGRGICTLAIEKPFGERSETTLSADELGIFLTEVGNAQATARCREKDIKRDKTVKAMKRRKT